MIDLAYYINVYDLMMIDRPRPTPTVNPNFLEEGVEVPVIPILTGEDR